MIVDGEPNAHAVKFKVGVQEFFIGRVNCESREHAEWFASMFRKALYAWGVPRSAINNQVTPNKFKPGDRVIHAHYGEVTIVEPIQASYICSGALCLRETDLTFAPLIRTEPTHTLAERARAYATMAHERIGQRRKYTDEPHITHPAAVVALVWSIPHDEAMIAAAWPLSPPVLQSAWGQQR
jgi:hypothetical protein